MPKNLTCKREEIAKGADEVNLAKREEFTEEEKVDIVTTDQQDLAVSEAQADIGRRRTLSMSGLVSWMKVRIGFQFKFTSEPGDLKNSEDPSR